MNRLQAFTDSLVIYAGFNVGTMIVQLIFFIVLLALVTKFAWRPVMNMMKEREDYVASEIDEAELSRKDAEKASQEAQDYLKQMKEETQQMLEDARNAGVKQKEEILASANEEAERLKTTALADIENEKEKAVQALQDQVASISVLIASKVIEKELSAEDQESLINDYIKEVGDSNE